MLPWPHIQHPASEVGLLEHQPVAFQHIARLAVRHVVAILDRFTVVHQLVGLSCEVVPLIDPHSELSPVLQKKKIYFYSFQLCKLCVYQSI